MGAERAGTVFKALAVAASALIATAAEATVITLDFDTDAAGNPILAGQILDNEYAAFGVRISVINVGGGPNLGVAFDSANPTGGDDDLRTPASIGNARTEAFRNIAIIQENGQDADGDGFIDVQPDDEGSRPAGSIFFDLDFLVEQVSFALIDIEDVGEFNGDRGFFRAYLGESPIFTLPFGALVGGDSDVVFGNNSANRVRGILMPRGGANRLEFNFGGSGAVGELQLQTQQVPEPVTLWLLGAAFVAAASLKTRRLR